MSSSIKTLLTAGLLGHSGIASAAAIGRRDAPQECYDQISCPEGTICNFGVDGVVPGYCMPEAKRDYYNDWDDIVDLYGPGHVVRRSPDPIACDDDDVCPDNLVCTAGVCQLPPPNFGQFYPRDDTDCEADEDCGEGGQCAANICIYPTLGDIIDWYGQGPMRRRSPGTTPTAAKRSGIPSGYTCGDGNECPVGLYCSEGTCYAPDFSDPPFGGFETTE